MWQDIKNISVPYGNISIGAKIPASSLIFEGKMKEFTPRLREWAKVSYKEAENFDYNRRIVRGRY